MKTLFYAVLTTAIGCASAHAQQVEVADSKVAGQPMADGSNLFYGIPTPPRRPVSCAGSRRRRAPLGPACSGGQRAVPR